MDNSNSSGSNIVQADQVLVEEKTNAKIISDDTDLAISNEIPHSRSTGMLATSTDIPIDLTAVVTVWMVLNVSARGKSQLARSQERRVFSGLGR